MDPIDADTARRTAGAPALPEVLLQPWPVISSIAAGWLVAVVLAFTVPDCTTGDR